MLKRIAIILTFVLAVATIFLALFQTDFILQFIPQLFSVFTTFLITLWGVAYRKELAKLKRAPEDGSAIAPKQIIKSKGDLLDYSDENSNQNIGSDSDSKTSELLPDKGHPEKLNFDNDLIDEIYGEALKIATTIFFDSKLSVFSIQVDPNNALCPYITQQRPSPIIISYFFYSKNANKICLMVYSEADGLTHHLPDEDAAFHETSTFSKIPWTNTNWNGFIVKAYQNEKPLSKNTYYNVMAVSFVKKLPWSIIFHDTFNGSKHSYDWDGKGKDLKSIIMRKR